MSQPAAPRGSATIENLYRVPDNGKAEIVEGELVLMSPTGFLPGRASWAICASLRKYEEETGRGYAIPDNVGFIVDLPNRRSFSPDAAFYVGEPTGGKFLQGAPIFAAEVRSEEDYGTAAEKKMAAKRADYFAAGTRIVWDVDVLRKRRGGGVGPGEAARAPRLRLRGRRGGAPRPPRWAFPGGGPPEGEPQRQAPPRGPPPCPPPPR